MDVEANLRTYYRDLFPTELIFKTLEISPNREVSFFTPNGAYMRFLTFDNVESFKEKLLIVNPKKLDLGAIYDIRPSKSNGAIPVARELVFDIDLTDYPRDCCQEKKICSICYNKIKCAVKLLDYILEEELGFKNYGFVFSGRRGVHCWVLEMKDLGGHVRNDIYKYLQMVIDKNLYIEPYDRIMSEFGDSDLVKNFFLRIDKQVTVTMNHLIKMPFSVHPDTLNISVPLDPKNITEFNDLPTLEAVVSDPQILLPYYEIMKRWFKSL